MNADHTNTATASALHSGPLQTVTVAYLNAERAGRECPTCIDAWNGQQQLLAPFQTGLG